MSERRPYSIVKSPRPVMLFARWYWSVSMPGGWNIAGWSSTRRGAHRAARKIGAGR